MGTTRALKRGLDAEAREAELEELEGPEMDVMTAVDATCRAALGDRLDTNIVDALADAMSELVAKLERELSARKGVRYPDRKPTHAVVSVWRQGPWGMGWLKHKADSLKPGEYWRVWDGSAPDERKEGGA